MGWGSRRRTFAGWLLAVVLVVAAATIGRAPTPVAAQEPGPAPAGAGGTRVTLITGDRVVVTVDGGRLDVVNVEPAPGREGIAFHHFEFDGHLHVVPVDAFSLLGRGQLDRRLFDVTGLVRHGYDDDHRGDLPLVVVGDVGAASDVPELAGQVDDTATAPPRQLASIGAVATTQDKATVTEMWDRLVAPAGAAGAEANLAGDVGQIWLDGPVRATLDESVPQIGAPEVWQAGHTGEGSTVAVLDTGIDGTHSDLDDAVVATRDFTGRSPGVEDGYGHGTHVASILTGSGDGSGGRHAGVAPDADLLVGKVLDDLGGGYESWIIAGMEWAAAQGADVANVSLGSDFGADGTGPMDLAVDRLTADTGTLFVVSAGNSGPDSETVSSPGSAGAALTVGAVDKQDAVAEFSSRGPRWQNPAIKPEITAPGVDITAAQAKGTYLGEPDGEGYVRLSGTSMAAPHVAGAAAILAAQHPDWDADELKGALVASAEPNPSATVDEQGAGRLDLPRADAQHVTSTPAAFDAGLARWPHSDDTPVVTPVTYRNTSSSPVTLELSVEVDDPGQNPAPQSMFTVSADQVTVAAGGEATVEVTIDTRVPGPDGRYGGALVASATTGDVRVRTPLAVTKEVESYDVVIEALDERGAPASYSLLLVGLDDASVEQGFGYYSETLRLPAGRYFTSWSVSGSATTFGAEPTFEVTGDTTLRLDGQGGSPIGTTVDQADAEEHFVSIEAVRRTPEGDVVTGTFGYDFSDLRVRPSESAVAGDEFGFSVDALMARPDGSGGYADSPYYYGVRWSEQGRVPSNLVRHVPDDGLTVVDGVFAAPPAGAATSELNGAVTMSLPGRLRQLYSPGAPWPRYVSMVTEQGSTQQWATERTFEAGRRYLEPWNFAVFGPRSPSQPALRTDGSPYQLSRRGPDLVAAVRLFSQQGVHLGWSPVDGQSLTLSRNGEPVPMRPVIFSDPTFGPVPWEEGTFRLEASATRSVVDLSTRVDAAWTFRSTGTRTEQPLPMIGARVTPLLDDHNRAPSGVPFAFPVSVDRQPGAAYGTLQQFDVEVSYDDGQTWRRAQVHGGGDHRLVTVTHPAGPGYVSLRIKLADSTGTAFETTIIHAYALRS